MRIGDRDIALEAPPYIIAEIGVNHDGSAERAIELVDAAASAGADAVKVQVFEARLLMSQSALLAAYQADAGENDPIAMLERLELSWEALHAVVQRAHAKGMHAIATVFSLALVGRAKELGVDAFKTASPDIVHKPLLDALAGTRTPLIVSTGAATESEILRASEWLRGSNALFLQCVSAYPTPPELAALGGIEHLGTLVGGSTGYSDHTTLVETGGLAVMAGACALEKHLTYDCAAVGPDHAASLEPACFAEYVRFARQAHQMRGGRVKSLQAIESDVRKVSRQSLITTRRIARGETLSTTDITFKRPGGGMEPWRLSEAMGRGATREIEADTQIQESDLE